MISIHHIEPPELHRIRIACSYLFSPALADEHKFLSGLDGSTLRNAFRDKAKRYHPDLHRHETEETLKRRRERFVKIKESYDLLKGHIQEESHTAPLNGAGKRKIIAVGGAKGGVGKSIIAANLAAYLCSRGNKTVAIDLDLGGANLHLYLGETQVKHSVNDFLSKQAESLQEIMMPTKYGPLLIGGDSSHLGAGNIGFARKLKLLKAIRAIEADYVILDLGGDTSYNMVDFFLTADEGIVLTSCDPASYLDAYNFIKVSLYRRLSRIYGPESDHEGEKDEELEVLLREMLVSDNGKEVKHIRGLLEKIRAAKPESLAMIKEVLSGFRPHLLVNMVSSDSDEKPVIARIQEVSKKMLMIHVKSLGILPYLDQVKKSAVTLTPAVFSGQKGPLTKKLAEIVACIDQTAGATTFSHCGQWR
jgi:flagellar biosynthesis protein FlhG